MNIKYRLYISIALLLSATESIVSAQESYACYDKLQTQQACDDRMHAIFVENFFNDQNKTLFSQIISDIIDVLKVKRNALDHDLQLKYDQIIALLEKNKDSAEFMVWSKILIAPELKAILPVKTQEFLDSIPNFKKVKALINKLNNN